MTHVNVYYMATTIKRKPEQKMGVSQKHEP